jgi:hypothetical protein
MFYRKMNWGIMNWEMMSTLSIAGSILMLVTAGVVLLYVRYFVSTAARAQGVVIDNVVRQGSYYPVDVFTDSNGGFHTVHSTVGANPPEYAVGARLNVFYQPKDLNSTMIDDFTHVWELPIMIGGLAAFYLPVGLVVRWRLGQAPAC